MVLVCSGFQRVAAEGSLDIDFDDLKEAKVDGQNGWRVYDKVRDTSAILIASGVGTSGRGNDKALVVTASESSIRCATVSQIAWSRGQTLKLEFDFRLVVPEAISQKNSAVMTFLLGNSILAERSRWAVELASSTNGNWILSAALPDPAQVEIPGQALKFNPLDGMLVSQWMHCVVEIEKLSEQDSFDSSVRIQDSDQVEIASLVCDDTNKEGVTRAMWDLSRVSVGFLAASDNPGLLCIDHLQGGTTTP